MAQADKKQAIARRGVMLVLSSPSGAGKTTLSRMLLEAERGVALSISMTTRPRRPGEINGRHYYFVTPARFDKMVRNKQFLESAKVFGFSYGTPRAPVEKALRAGRDVLFDIDWQGTQQLREKSRGDLVSVFVLPPTIPEYAHGQGGRRNEPLGGVRLRHRQSRFGSCVRAGACDPGGGTAQARAANRPVFFRAQAASEALIKIEAEFLSLPPRALASGGEGRRA